MSKNGELTDVLSELKQCGESLVRISDELMEMLSGSKETEKRSAQKKAETNTEEIEKTPEAAEPMKEYSFTDVRTILAEKSRAGHTAEIRSLLTKHGAEKLSEIRQEDYAALVAEAEAL